jgi:hypothetical protein
MDRLKCPKCKSYGLTICLTSYPAQYEFDCYCGFKLKYYDRKDSYKDITQEELNEHLTTAST